MSLYLDRIAEEKPNFFTSKDFTIMMAKISSVEDEEKAADRDSKMNFAQSLIGIADGTICSIY